MSLESRLFAIRRGADRAAVYRDLHDGRLSTRSITGFRVVFRERDVAEVLRSRQFQPTPAGSIGTAPSGAQAEFNRVRALAMPFAASEGHDSMRTLLAKHFSAAALDDVRPHVIELVADRAASLPRGEPIDIGAAYAAPIAEGTLARVLGTSSELAEQFRSWALELTPTIELFHGRGTADEANRVLVDVRALLYRIASGHEHVGAGVFATLVGAVRDGRATLDEAVANVMFLLGAGQETVRTALAWAIANLASSPADWERLRSSDAAIAAYVEECLRTATPLQFTMRTALEDITLPGGDTVSTGDAVLVALGAANGDPAAYPNPSELAPREPPARHHAFGGGAHYCIGAALARLEMEVGLRRLVRTFAGASLTTPVEWAPSLTLHQLHEFRICLR